MTSPTWEREQILRKAVREYGALPQIMMLFEEMGELMTALNQWTRGRVDPSQIVEEVADVYIMLQQLPYAIEVMTSGETDADSFETLMRVIVDSKIERLAMRMTVSEVQG